MGGAVCPLGLRGVSQAISVTTVHDSKVEVAELLPYPGLS